MDMVVVLHRYRYRIGLLAIGGERKLVLKRKKNKESIFEVPVFDTKSQPPINGKGDDRSVCRSAAIPASY